MGTSGGKAVCRSRASRQAMGASLASSFLRAGPRRRATRSGLTGRTTWPASSRRSTSSPWRVSITTRTSAGSGSRAAIWAMSWSTAAGCARPGGSGSPPLLGVSKGDEVEGLGPVDPNPKHHASSRRSPSGGGAAPC
jgi:hypothetical protein